MPTLAPARRLLTGTAPIFADPTSSVLCFPCAAGDCYIVSAGVVEEGEDGFMHMVQVSPTFLECFKSSHPAAHDHPPAQPALCALHA